MFIYSTMLGKNLTQFILVLNPQNMSLSHFFFAFILLTLVFFLIFKFYK